jgi:alpha-maltose-1-phosphate synthase
MDPVLEPSRPPRPLVIAEAANPEWPSVPLVGWNLGRALVERAGAHLVTQIRNRAALERAGWREGREFTALDTERVARPAYLLSRALQRLGLGWTVDTAIAALPYYEFERQVWRRFGEAIRAGRYDLVHRITPLTPTIPSPIARRCARAGTPFVWGPLNGGVRWPREFETVRRAEGEWLSYVRGAHRLLPGFRATRDSAAATLVGSCATREQFQAWAGRTVYLPENGIDPLVFHAPRAVREPGPLRVVWVGRLVPYKGADMLLEAAAPMIRSGRLRVEIVGDGPERPALERLIDQEGLGGGATLTGWVGQQEVAARMRRADVFGFPSVREFGGGVVLEAMALGLAPVVLGYAGPDELVSDSTGFRIPMGPRQEVVEGFREVLDTLAARPELAAAIGDRARRRVERWFTWEAKVDQVMQVYEWVLGRRGRPDFGMPFPDDRAVASTC